MKEKLPAPCTINWYTSKTVVEAGVERTCKWIYEEVKVMLPMESLQGPVMLQSTPLGAGHYNDVDVNRGSERVLSLKWTGYQLIKRKE